MRDRGSPGTDPEQLAALVGPDGHRCRRGVTGEEGVSLPAFTDHHVHLHLVDEHGLTAHGIAAVVDLGGDPVGMSQRDAEGMPRVAYAGAFLTVPGGYPSGRSWAPDAIVRLVRDPSPHAGVPGGAATAVDEQVAFGASVIKVALNSVAGPVPDSTTLGAVVARAHEHGVPVVAHVEGEGMTARALEAAVDVLAHTPFTERLDDALAARCAAQGQRWISTLAIHGGDDLARATANLAAFVRAGGVVLYGTDLGNGDRAPGIQREELDALRAAGIVGAALVASLVDPWPSQEPSAGVRTFVPGPLPSDPSGVPEWLTAAVVVPADELVHLD